jgi:predicted ATP-grasp superfamily ATP-dependent carboligase
MAPLKVFAFDYVMEGGQTARALPRAFTQQGEMLIDALLADLGTVPGVEVCTMATLHAPGLAPPGPSFAERFAACVQTADAVWPLAPESDGLLENLSRDILRGKRILLGSAPGAVRVAASKFKVARALAEGGVPTVPTYRPHASLPDDEGAWVVKPDDGAGCVDTRLFSNRAAALAWIRTSAAQGYILQPFVAGKLGSLSLLCCDGAARLLARNQERVVVHDNRFHFLGSTVNGLIDADGALERLAQQVAAALPTLWGYVGVDIILTDHGAVVLDVNPRLTAAYAGLHASIGCNPAGLVIDLLKGPALPALPAKRRVVSVDVGSADAGSYDAGSYDAGAPT